MATALVHATFHSPMAKRRRAPALPAARYPSTTGQKNAESALMAMVTTHTIHEASTIATEHAAPCSTMIPPSTDRGLTRPSNTRSIVPAPSAAAT